MPRVVPIKECQVNKILEILNLLFKGPKERLFKTAQLFFHSLIFNLFFVQYSTL